MFGNFGNQQPTFGGGAFSNTPQTASVFGQPQQPAASTSLFGGGFNQAKPTFGSSFSAPLSQSTSMFGQQNRLPVPSSGGIFSGQTAAVSPFSATTQQQVSGTSVPFNAITGNDTMMKNGVASPISTRHQCITCMKEYENKSLEELRLEDYQLNRKGPSQGSLFGATQPQQSTGLFSTMGANTTSTPFGQATTFGSNTASGGLFSSLSQPKPATSFFSSPATATSAFGSPSGFSFSNPTSQQPSVFGANNNAVSSSGGLGTTSSFSFGQPQTQQPQAGGLFGQKPLTTTTASGFGGFGGSTLAAANVNKPFGFGSGTTTTFGSTPAPAFGTGTGSLFSSQPQQQQAKPFSFNSSFSNPAQPTQPTFGSTGGSSFTLTTTTSAPTLNFGTGSGSAFGNLGGGTTTSFGTPSFSLGGSGGFGGTTSFGSALPSSTGFPNFSAPTTNFAQPNMMQQSVAAPVGPVAFATTPYKDSPLFYNLIANRNLDDMIKPTSPQAQRAIKEASRRRTSASISLSGHTPNKNVTFPMSKNSSFNKSIFDGFEEDEKGITIDILSPKTSVKKLALKNFRNSSIPSHRHSISFAPSARLRGSVDNGFNDTASSEFDHSRNSESGLHAENSGRKSCEDLSASNLEADSYNVQINAGQKRQSDADRSAINGRRENGGCRVINTRGGYYIDPPLEKLDKLVDDNGNCYVQGLKIGRQNHGEIRFRGIVNVAGLNLDEIVHFRHKEVVVYPDDNHKPPLGEGLNCPAEITLERVWPIDKETMDPIKLPARLYGMCYEETLRRACQRLEAEFVSYNPEGGLWSFKVDHFSKYSCDVEESEDVNKADIASAGALKGLGGISMHQMPSNFPPKPMAETGPKPLNQLALETPQRWRSQLAEIDELEPMPVFRNRISAQSTPLVHVSPGLEDSDLAYGDVEHNPLTPSESNDSELDWQLTSIRGFGTEFHSVLKDKPESEKVRMMKSAMLMEGNIGEEGDFQPPIKKSRQIRVKRASEVKNFMRGTDPIISEKPTHFPNQVLVLINQTKTVVASDKRVRVIDSERTDRDVRPIVSGYIASIKKREQIKLKSLDEDLFRRLEMRSSGTKVKPMPRVCFGPMGHFITISNSKDEDSHRQRTIKVNRIGSYMEKLMPISSRSYMQVIDEQMNLQLNSATNGYLVSDHINLLKGFLHPSKSGNTSIDLKRISDELMMWELLQILWPVRETDESLLRDKGFSVTQRKELSRWFKVHWKTLFGNEDSNERTFLGLLKKGKRKEACELAVKTRNYTMALCLAQKPQSVASSFSCERQLIVWEDQGALDFVPEDMVDAYRLACGQPIFGDIDDLSQMSTSQWLQHFALYLWYTCPIHLAVDEIVVYFQTFLKNFVDDFENPSFPAKEESSIPYLCVQLLKLYSFTGFSMKSILNPRTSNVDCLDYKLSWLLMTNLERFGYVCDPELYGSITTAYAGQLEQISLYKWAIYVMNNLPMSDARDDFVQKILERNVGVSGDLQNEFFLARDLCIPPKLIFAAKSLRASVERRKDRLIWYLLKAGSYQKAFDELLKCLSIDCVMKSQNMKNILTILMFMEQHSNKIRGWNIQGVFLMEYLKMLLAKKATEKGELSNGSNWAKFESVIVSFVDCFMRHTPKTEEECAFLLELVLGAQKIVEVLMDGSSDYMERTGSEYRISSIMDLTVPREYMEELQCFLTHWLTK